MPNKGQSGLNMNVSTKRSYSDRGGKQNTSSVHSTIEITDICNGKYKSKQAQCRNKSQIDHLHTFGQT